MKRLIVLGTLGVLAHCNWASALTNRELGNLFDQLVGKQSNSERFQACIENRCKDPWFAASAHAYHFARTAYQQYSIESGNTEKKLRIPKIIHQIWLGSEMPEKYIAWISTWSKHHPTWTYILWTDEDLPYLNLVNGDLLDRTKNLGELSDILRLELLYQFGGLYVDVDYECYKPMDAFHYCNDFYTSIYDLTPGIAVNNALIASSTAHPLMKTLVVEDLRTCAGERDMSDRSGPRFFTRSFFTDAPLYDHVVAYPWPYLQPWENYQKAQDITYEGGITSYARHWWEASWLLSMDCEKKMKKKKRLEYALPSESSVEKKRAIRNTPLERALTSEYMERRFSRAHDQTDIWSALFADLGVQTVVELGACQFLVNNEPMTGITYTGISPIKFMVLDYRLAYPDEHRNYFWKDWTQEMPPTADLVLLGDILDYLPLEDCLIVMNNVAKSGAKYMIITHDEQQPENSDTPLGQKRTLNLCQAPFASEKPLAILTIDNIVYGLWKRN